MENKGRNDSGTRIEGSLETEGHKQSEGENPRQQEQGARSGMKQGMDIGMTRTWELMPM